MEKISDFIKKNPLVFDGAMGTYYLTLTGDKLANCEIQNCLRPSLISQIHEEYLKAGAKAIKTNTFNIQLIETANEYSFEEIIRCGYRIAKKAASKYDAYVFADLGPIISTEEDEIFENYKKVVDIFIEEGATCFLFETQLGYDGLALTTSYIKDRVPDAFIIISFAVSADGFTKDGNGAQNLIDVVRKNKNTDALGFNCVTGPKHLGALVNSIHKGEKPFVIMPNAGYPTVVGSRSYYDNNAEYFAKEMIDIISSGVKIVGGCCGTTPKHIELLVENMQKANIVDSSKYVKNIVINEKSEDNRFLNKINNKKKVIAVEFDSPLIDDLTDFMEKAKELQNSDVDIITIADCPVARARMDSSILACKIHRQLGIDVLPHLTCRDRNTNATRALLLGLSVEGIRNVLLVTGDPVPLDIRNEIKSVFQFNSRKMAKYITELNKTNFKNPFGLFGALNVNADNFEVALDVAKEKIESGMQGFFTQPIFDNKAIENLQRAKKELKVPIMGGILPVISYRNAEFMNNEIPGIYVSDEIKNRYLDKSKEKCTEIAIEVSSKIAKDVSEIVDGYYIITPFKRVDIVTELIKNIKKQDEIIKNNLLKGL